MNQVLRFLLLEDSPVDAELNERELRKAGISFTSLRVESLPAFVAALDEFKPDLILADYHLPGFDGLRPLAITREKYPEIPFIFVSGAMGEERAADSIKHGATDYIIKDRLARLPSAVQRALEEKAARVQRRESEERYHQLFENMSSGVAIFQPDQACQRFVFKAINRAAEHIDLIRREEVIGHSVEEIFPGVRDMGLLDVFKRVCQGGEVEHASIKLYRDERISGWRENNVYRLKTGEVVAVYEDVSERIERETRIKHLNRVLRTISACNEDLVRARSEEDLLIAVCRNIVEIGGHLLAWVSNPSEAANQSSRTIAHFGDEAALQTHAELQQDPEHARNCLTLEAMRKRQTTSLKQVVENGEQYFGQLYAKGVRDILALPLLNNGQLYGVLTVFSAMSEAFNAHEVQLMEELSADLAYGIEALRTTAERDHYIGQFSKAMKNTVTAIARTLEMRDPYTAGHQQRVTALSVSIARAMGLGEEVIEGLYFGAMIHDIGKISVPAEILSKPGALTKIEHQLIQCHPETGFGIVQDVEFPWPVAEMIAQHHERLDGSGYPHALKNDQIIIEARIIAVADVVEAMSTHRPYRPARGIAAALEEIEQGKGSRYDPTVVEACIQVVKENDMQLPQL